MTFHGIYVPIITPLSDDGSIDVESYGAMLDTLIEAGVDGICVGGTTGENYALSVEERVWQFEFARTRIDGRIPWVAGINDIRTEVVCDLAREAVNNGSDALLVAVPPYSLPDQKELAAHVLKVDREGNLPIMLYNYPARSGAEFGREFLERVASSENIVAIKESSGDGSRIRMIAREFPHIQLSCGADDQALEFFAWGASSWVCAAANFLPRECHAVYDHCVVNNDFATGRRLMKAILPVMTVLERGGKFVQCVKYGCALDGMPTSTTVRLPLRPMKKELERSLREAIEVARATVASILREKGDYHE